MLYTEDKAQRLEVAMPENKPTRDVFKLQWPIVGHTVLIYNADRSMMGQIAASDDLGAFFKEHDPEMALKLYVECEITDEGLLMLERDFKVIPRSEWPSW
jgi:hypothetical protein